MADMEAAQRQVIETLLWQGLDEADEPLDTRYGPEDVSPRSRERLIQQFGAFLDRLNGPICRAMREREGYGLPEVAHDWILTRNGHGAGFWDRGLGLAGDILTAACAAEGTVETYLGDDGMIHIDL